MTPAELDAELQALREQQRARLTENRAWLADRCEKVAQLDDPAARAEMTARLDQFEAMLDDPGHQHPD